MKESIFRGMNCLGIEPIVVQGSGEQSPMTVSRESICRLVQHCAAELTSAGHSPFTRRDLISWYSAGTPNMEQIP